MAIGADYIDYLDWGGELGEDAFWAALPHARAYVRRLVGFNAP